MFLIYQHWRFVFIENDRFIEDKRHIYSYEITSDHRSSSFARKSDRPACPAFPIASVQAVGWADPPTTDISKHKYIYTVH